MIFFPILINYYSYDIDARYNAICEINVMKYLNEFKFTACNTQMQLRSLRSLQPSANGSVLLSPAPRAIQLFKFCRIAPFRNGDSGVQTTSAVFGPVGRHSLGPFNTKHQSAWKKKFQIKARKTRIKNNSQLRF